MRKIFFVKLSFLVLCVLLVCSAVRAQTVISFSYQGRLNDAGAPANGQFDFLFKLYPTAEGGAQIGTDLTRDDLLVTNGVFSTHISFGTTPFVNETGFYVEVWVRPGASTGAYTPLAPRVALQAVPYALKSVNASLLDNLPVSQFVQTNDARLSDARVPLPNSANYIQNTTAQQSSANFNISGSGRLGGTLFANRADIGLPTAFSGVFNLVIGGDSPGLRVDTTLPNASLASFGSNGFFSIDGGGFSGMRMLITPSGDVGFGIHAPQYKLHVIDASNRGLRVQNNTTGGTIASFGNSGNFQIDASDTPGGRFIVLENGRVGVGTNAPTAKLDISGTGILRARINSDSNAGVQLTLNNQPGWSVATVTGGQFQIFNDAAGQNAFWITTTNNVGIGTITPQDRLDVNGIIRFSGLGSAGGTQLCRNASNQISTCSSSIRYKSNVNNFGSGLDLIRRLRPVSFNWKDGGMLDLGLVAEEVFKIEPLLTTLNDKGEIEGVKYDRIGVVAVNAIKEQQTQIEAQQKQISEQSETIKRQTEKIERQQTELERQRLELEALKKLVCTQNPEAEICRQEKRF